ncbi:anti-sigma regulatory factor (Ser/Thr protein kinase) [Dysgonomonadaceae bacterium PH5-43]|nr:anti-sigma regulatory factor (Ser/Thr protein kinase) [Dysgonomonadaceae bacterium PH5-43]
MKLKLELTNNILCISPALSFVEALCREKGLSEKENKQFQLALEEVLSNVVQHAFDNNEESFFDVFITDTSSYIEIKIRELGIPFIWENAQQFDPTQIHSVDDAVNQKGLGTYIISQMVDKLEYKYLGVKGKETILIKHINNPQVTEYKHKTKPKVHYRPEDITVHLFEEKESLNVARCLYSTYGYSYLKFAMYEPKYLCEVAKQEDTIIVTAVASDNEVAGVIIGKEDESTNGIMEIGSLVVAPEFRGLHLAESLFATIQNEIARSTRNGVFAECVTIHLASQRVSLKAGLKPCAVLLNQIPNSVNFKEFDKQRSERQTFILVYMSMTDRKSRIYLPSNHTDKIKRIYERINVEYEVLTTTNELPNVCDLAVQRNDTSGISIIFVKRIGADLGSFLSRILRLSEFSKIKTWSLYLYMHDPQLEYAIEEAEKANFIFTGILPGTDNGDLLIMQNATDVEWIREEVLLVEPEKDEWMLDYIEDRYNEIKEKQ